MDFDVDAAVRQAEAQMRAMVEAENTPPEEIDPKQLMPVFVPASFLNPMSCAPWQRLRNPDFGMTWGVLMPGGVLTYLNDRLKDYWQAKGIDWRALAARNLLDHSNRDSGARWLTNPRGERIAIKFCHEDGLGSSRLLFRKTLEKLFPNGYHLALPDRNCGMAFSSSLPEDDRRLMLQFTAAWNQRSPHPLVPGIYGPEHLRHAVEVTSGTSTAPPGRYRVMTLSTTRSGVPTLQSPHATHERQPQPQPGNDPEAGSPTKGESG